MNRNTHNFFGAFEVTFLMLRVCFKPITWYIEAHHMRTFFLCGIMTLLYLWDIHSQSVYLQEKSLLRFLLVIELSSIAAVYQLKIKIIHMIRTNLMHFLDTFSMIKIQWAFLSKINTLATDSQLCGCRGLLGRVVRKEGKYED